MFKKQNKGKDINKIPTSKLDTEAIYYISMKLDGHYTQIVYDGVDVKFYTSGNKEFYLDDVANDIKRTISEPFHIECEFIYDCDGKLGSRGKSAMLTTFRTNFNKGIKTLGGTKSQFMVLDRLDLPEYEFKYRVGRLPITNWLTPVAQIAGSLDFGKELAAQWVKEGYEGAMLKDRYHFYQEGKRTNDIIKIKPRLTADLKCIGYKDGTGKYEGMIGSLLLCDSIGREVLVGSGLNDNLRDKDPEYFLGKVIEIEYERVDNTYIQPIFKCIRDDKDIYDID